MQDERNQRAASAESTRDAPCARRFAHCAPARARFRHACRGALAVEVLIRVGAINRFIVPLPSQIVASFERVIVEEDIGGRFRLTFFEALDRRCADHRGRRVGLACSCIGSPVAARSTETWVAALASAPTVLMYPLFLVIFGRSAWTIIMMGFVAGLPPVILKTIEGLAGTRRVLDQCWAELQAHRAAAVHGRSCFRRRCRPSSSACGSA